MNKNSFYFDPAKGEMYVDCGKCHARTAMGDHFPFKVSCRNPSCDRSFTILQIASIREGESPSYKIEYTDQT